ncbi:fumarylacetoacetate hydrolase family protein [Xylaria bambusicola]|uniref:fumarylacetoacetate hydrolase family protein n=1 Tax=Xylaria bambusicola TaxID=326684 RepID=UPI00200800D3|nr:fumarylacetoacetate hydrolase family protein [Xylaria bambusicola]KAI0502929.1 fumarylacetoacetate hydrolase family protein [Xylaria bambusicola]
MGSFTKLVRFKSDNDTVYYTDLGDLSLEAPAPGSQVTAYISFEDLLSKRDSETATVKELLAPLPQDGLPIYCVGLNYKSHAAEAKFEVSDAPPLWVKPAAALANPGQDIVLNKYCAASLPDYEAELVFVTSKTCKDISESEAEDAILGYTIGNDLSCRLFQMPKQSGGQFYYAKAFDNFAPIGPTLVSKAAFPFSTATMALTVNGEQRQQAKFEGDLVFSPAKILSYMSQGTTIPAYTAVMTGTPSGVGAFMDPKQFLKHGDEVRISITSVGELKNKIIVAE